MEPEPDLHTGSDQKVPSRQHWSAWKLVKLQWSVFCELFFGCWNFLRFLVTGTLSKYSSNDLLFVSCLLGLDQCGGCACATPACRPPLSIFLTIVPSLNRMWTTTGPHTALPLPPGHRAPPPPPHHNGVTAPSPYRRPLAPLSPF